MLRLTFDIEANGLLEDVTTIHCAVFKNLDNGVVVKLHPDADGNKTSMYLKLVSMFEKADLLIGHNIIDYDLPLVKKILDVDYEGKLIDTLVMSRTLSPNRQRPYSMPKDVKGGPHSLAAWGYRVGRGKPEHEDWEAYSPAMLHRCSEDVEITEMSMDMMTKEEMNDGDWTAAMQMTMTLFTVLHKVRDYGWKVDVPKMNNLIHELGAMQGDILKEADSELPYVKEIGSTVNKPFTKSGNRNATDVKWYTNRESRILQVSGPYTRITYRKLDLNKRAEVIPLLIEHGWKPAAYNEDADGNRTSPKLNKDDPFDGIEGNLGELAAKFIQIRHRKSLLEGLLKLVRDDGRISSRVTGLAQTGRAKHAGIVNIPNGDAFFGKEIRSIFIHEEDKVLVGVDSSSNQARQLCALMGDEDYEYAVIHGKESEGTDVHTMNQKAAGLPTRSNAKTFLYGFLFGAGDEKIGSIVHGTAADGARLKAQFLEGLPLLGNLINSLKEEWRENSSKRRAPSKWGFRDEHYNGWVKGLDGRPIYIASEHAILVYVLQSMEAIQMSYALLYTYKWAEQAGLKWGEDWGVVSWMHDEINAECKPEHAKFIGETIRRSIIVAGKQLGISTPHDGNIKTGDSWYEIH